jgi:hypothetical protein
MADAKVSLDDIEVLDETTGEFTKLPSSDKDKLGVQQTETPEELIQGPAQFKDMSSEQKTDTINALLSHGAQGATGGWSDELKALIKPGNYESNIQEERANLAKLKEEHPLTSMVGEGLGIGVGMAALPEAAATPVTSFLSKFPKIAKNLNLTPQMLAKLSESTPILEQVAQKAQQAPKGVEGLRSVIGKSLTGASDAAILGGLTSGGFSEKSLKQEPQELLQDVQKGAKLGALLGGGLSGGLEALGQAIKKAPAHSAIARDTAAGYEFGKRGVNLGSIPETAAAEQKLIDLSKETQNTLATGAGKQRQEAAEGMLELSNVLTKDINDRVKGQIIPESEEAIGKTVADVNKNVSTLLPQAQNEAIQSANDIIDFIGSSKSKVGKEIGNYIKNAEDAGRTVDVSELLDNLQKQLNETKTYVGDERIIAKQVANLLEDYKQKTVGIQPQTPGAIPSEQLTLTSQQTGLRPSEVQNLRANLGELAFNTPSIQGKLKKPLVEGYRGSGEALQNVVLPQDVPSFGEANKKYTALQELNNLIGGSNKYYSLGEQTPTSKLLNVVTESTGPSTLLNKSNQETVNKLLSTVDPIEAPKLMSTMQGSAGKLEKIDELNKVINSPSLPSNLLDKKTRDSIGELLSLTNPKDASSIMASMEQSANKIEEMKKLLGETSTSNILNTVSKAYKENSEGALLAYQRLEENLKKILPENKVKEYLDNARNLATNAKVADDALKMAEIDPNLMSKATGYTEAKTPKDILNRLAYSSEAGGMEGKAGYDALIKTLERYNPEQAQKLKTVVPDLADQVSLGKSLQKKQTVGDVRELRGSLEQLGARTANKLGRTQKWFNELGKASDGQLQTLSQRALEAGKPAISKILKSMLSKDVAGRNATMFVISQDPSLRKEFDSLDLQMGDDTIKPEDIEIIE